MILQVFLKYWHTEQLNIMMDTVGWKVVHCQRFVRGWLVRKHFRGMLELSRQDQAAVRGFCVYLTNASQDRFNFLNRQDEHDKIVYADRVSTHLSYVYKDENIRWIHGILQI